VWASKQAEWVTKVSVGVEKVGGGFKTGGGGFKTGSGGFKTGGGGFKQPVRCQMSSLALKRVVGCGRWFTMGLQPIKKVVK
jgi:hypothetical protein